MRGELLRHIHPREIFNFNTGRVTRKEFVVPEALNFGNGKRLKVTVNVEVVEQAPSRNGPSQAGAK